MLGSVALAPLPLLAEHQRTSPGFERFVELVAPGLSRHPEAYRGREIVERAGYGWTTPKVEPTEIRGLLAVHLGVGADVDDEPIGHLGLDVRAVGLSVPPDAITELVNLDLDGGYPAERVIAALRSRLGAGRFLVTAGSGREGRYRVLIHVVPVAVDDMVARVGALLEAIGFPPKQGSAEVYPSPTKPSRLPFGSGACRVFDDELQPLRRQHPLELTEVFLRLDRAELPDPVTHGNGTGTAPGTRKRRRRRLLDRSAHSLEVLGWRRDGVGPGQRDRAVRELVALCHRRGLTEPEAVEELQRWVDDGGMARSRLARSPSRLQRYRDRDIPRRVRNYYDRYLQARPAPSNLTLGEVAAVVALAQSRAGEFTETVLGTFMLRALRRFRAAAITRWSVGGGLRIHRDEWRSYLQGIGGQGRYRQIRDACGIFTPVTGYLSLGRAPRPDDAHAQAWTVDFTFDVEAPSPRRPVGGDPRAGGHYQAARSAVKRMVTCAPDLASITLPNRSARST